MKDYFLKIMILVAFFSACHCFADRSQEILALLEDFRKNPANPQQYMAHIKKVMEMPESDRRKCADIILSEKPELFSSLLFLLNVKGHLKPATQGRVKTGHFPQKNR